MRSAMVQLTNQPVFAAAVTAALLAASPAVADSPSGDPVEQFGESAGDGERLDLDAPADEISPPDDVEPPEHPVELRFELDESLSYSVASELAVGYDDRPEFEPVYQSGVVVEYEPVSERRRDRLPGRRLDDTDALGAGQPVVATVSQFEATFEQPDRLRDSPQQHALLRDAVFSFRLGDRGEVRDLRSHPPTNPLVHSSLEEIVGLLAVTQPPLPAQPLEPGDSWSESFEIDAGDDEVAYSMQTEADYSFEAWTGCASTYCALIEVEYDFDADGHREVIQLRTDSDAEGTAQGRFLFAPEKGRIVASQLTATSRGDAVVTRPDNEETEPLRQHGFELEAVTTMRLLEP